MRTIIIILIGLILIPIVAWVGATQWIVPKMVREEIEKNIRANCANCMFEARSISMPLLGFSIEFEGVRFKVGDVRAVLADIQANRIQGKVSLSDLFKHEFRLKKLEIYGAEVLVSEGDAGLPLVEKPPIIDSNSTEPPTEANAEPWVAVAEETLLHGSKFRYTRIHAGKEATISIHEIDAKLDTLGTSPEMRKQITTAEFTGLFEKTGKFVLNVKTIPFTEVLYVDIDVRLKNQDLADLNRYFDANEGTKFTGYLKDAQSLIYIRGPVLRGWLTGEYSHLDIQFKATKDRSSVEAFISNLVSGMTIDPSDVGEHKGDQSKAVRIQRKKREAFFKFLFRGLKDAAMAVASS